MFIKFTGNESNMDELEQYLATKNVARIIVITGGGLRGIIPAVYLNVLEENSGLRVKEMFNQIDGTSTGSIIACAVEDYSAEQLVEMYRKDGGNFFRKRCWLTSLWGFIGSKYDSNHLNNMYKQYLGDKKLSELSYDCLIPFYDLTNRTTRFFKSHRARLTSDEDYTLVTAMHCSSAAPTYFTPKEIDYVMPEKDFDYNQVRSSEESHEVPPKKILCCDGGLTTNDATMAAFVESCEIYPNADAFCILTIDTGRYSSSSVPNNMLKWGIEVPTICMNGSMDTAQHEIKELGRISTKKIFSISISTNIPEEYAAMDKSENIEPLYNIANSDSSNILRLAELGRLLSRYPKPTNLDMMIRSETSNYVRL